MAEHHISVRAEGGDNYGAFGIAGPMSIAREDPRPTQRTSYPLAEDCVLSRGPKIEAQPKLNGTKQWRR